MFTCVPFSMPWLDWTAYSFPGSKALKVRHYNGPMFMPFQVCSSVLWGVCVCMCVYIQYVHFDGYCLCLISILTKGVDSTVVLKLSLHLFVWDWHTFTCISDHLNWLFLKSSNKLCVVVYKMKVMYFCFLFFFFLFKYTKCKLCTMSVPIPFLCKARHLQVPILKNLDQWITWSTF